MDKKLRILFMGTPSFAIPSLQAVVASGHRVVGVVTRPPAKVGRKGILTKSPVHQWAQQHDLPCLTPHRMDEEAIHSLRTTQPDVIVTAAYGLLLPANILTLPRLAAVNLHASLLPRWRGASPIEHALIHDDATTGVTLMAMTKQLDQGDILMQKELPIDRQWNAQHLTHHLALLAQQLTHDYLALLTRHHPPKPTPQDDTHACYAPRLTVEDRRISFAHSVARILGQIRAFASSQGAWCDITSENNHSTRVHILKAVGEQCDSSETIGHLNISQHYFVCQDGIIKPLLVKKAGGRTMDFAELMRGWRHTQCHATL